MNYTPLPQWMLEAHIAYLERMNQRTERQEELLSVFRELAHLRNVTGTVPPSAVDIRVESATK